MLALNALLPPLTRASAVPPALPLVWSQAWKRRPPTTLPLQSAVGTKRTRVRRIGREQARALASVGVPNAIQLAPPSVEYCQLPLLLSTTVTAMPRAAPAASGSADLAGQQVGYQRAGVGLPGCG